MDAGASLDDLEKRLKPLIGENRPLAPFANYTLALARLQHGKTAEARDLLVVLKNGLDTPQDLSQQAAAVLSQIDSGTIAVLPKIDEAMRNLPAPAAGPGAAPAAPAASAPRP